MSHDRTRLVVPGCLAALSAASVLGVGRAGFAQDEGPIVIGGTQELEWLRLENFRAAIDIFARYQVDESDPPNGSTTRDTEELYREILELSADGFIGHPNLIDLDLLGKFGLSQEILDSDTLARQQHNDEIITDYDISALILREGDAPLTLYSRRSQTLLTRQFAGSLDSTVTEHGLRLRLRSGILPSQFQYFHREQDQTDRFGATDLNLTQDTFEWLGNVPLGEGQQLRWDYSFDIVDEFGLLRRENSFERHDGLLTHTLDFGPERHHNLRSTFRVFRQSGDFPLNRFRWEESLRLRHSPTFETTYDYDFDQQERADSNQTFQQGRIGLRHELFESLFTTAEIGASLLELSDVDFRSEQRFGSVRLDYNKIVPYGRLSASSNVNLNWQDDSEQGGTIQITDEQHVFDVSGLVVLNRRNIDITSIVITDGSGLILFQEGVDYTVRFFGDRVEIRRVIGGAIADGQVVLIDYSIGPEPGGIITTTGWGGTVRYDFDEGPLQGMGLYARYAWQDQDRPRSVVGGLGESDFQDFTYGIDYDFWRVTLMAEQQIRDSSLSPFEATRLEARYRQRLGRGSSLIFSATFDEIDNTDDDIQTAVTTISGRWNQQISNTLQASLYAIWRDEDDSAGIDSRAFEQWLDLTWRYHQTTIYASIRNAIVDSDADDTLFQTFLIGFRREF